MNRPLSNERTRVWAVRMPRSVLERALRKADAAGTPLPDLVRAFITSYATTPLPPTQEDPCPPPERS